jgi:hypothetical protein
MRENDKRDYMVMTDEVNNFKIENGAFKGFNEEIHIPYGVRRISAMALDSLKNMKRLVLPDTIEHFEPSDLREPFDTSTKFCCHIWGMVNVYPQSLKEIHVLGKNRHYLGKNGILYSADGKRLVYLPPSQHSITVEILEGTEELGEESCCFVNAEKIVFPKTLRRILDRACCSSNFKKSQIPLCEIGESAFQGSILPEYVDINSEVIPAKAFASCSKTKGVRLYDNVKLVKNEAFSYTDIEKIYIPPTTQIEENAFVREERRWVASQAISQQEIRWRDTKGHYEHYTENYKDLIIGGELGSPAEAFASANGIKFEVVGSSEEEIKTWLGWGDGIDETEEKAAAYYENENGELVAFDKDNLPF